MPWSLATPLGKARSSIFGPWFDTGFQRHKRAASQGLQLAMLAKNTMPKPMHTCAKCQKEHCFDFAIGGILKLVPGAISRDEWVHMLEEYRISDDGNSLNHILEWQTLKSRADHAIIATIWPPTPNELCPYRTNSPVSWLQREWWAVGRSHGRNDQSASARTFRNQRV
jgi:hypothetical protein